jgi:hypothetical protein
MARDGPSKLCEQDLLRRPLAILRAERARVRDVRRRRARARGGKRADVPSRGRDDERPRVRFETRAGVRDAVRCATTEADRRRLAWRLSRQVIGREKKIFYSSRCGFERDPKRFQFDPGERDVRDENCRTVRSNRRAPSVLSERPLSPLPRLLFLLSFVVLRV